MRTFVVQHVSGAGGRHLSHRAHVGPRVAFFSTAGRSGANEVFAELAALCGREPAATLALTDREIDRGYARRLHEFVQAIAPGTGRRRAQAPLRAVDITAATA
jgi:hypothetical protein